MDKQHEVMIEAVENHMPEVRSSAPAKQVQVLTKNSSHSADALLYLASYSACSMLALHFAQKASADSRKRFSVIVYLVQHLCGSAMSLPQRGTFSWQQRGCRWW